MDANELRSLARRGAAVRLAELELERQTIFKVFPDLKRASRGRTSGAGAAPVQRRKRRKMSAAERKEVSERMRRYWAARRAGGAKKEGAPAGKRRRSA